MDGVLVATALGMAERQHLTAWFPGENLVFCPVDRRTVLNLIIVLREDEIADEMANGFARRFPDLAARTGIVRWQKWAACALVLALIAASAAGSGIAIIAIVGLTFCACIFFKLMLAVASIGNRARRSHQSLLPDGDLPTYTILVPAYHEEEVIGPTVQWIADLDYPKSKLEIIVLVERRDTATAAAVARVNPPDYVRVAWLPPGAPQTKPRSCNLGLLIARGDLLVIFDAEDRPERDQLRKVAAQFANGGDRLACVQAKLNFYNARSSLLARMFSLEYAFWFDMMLPGLDRLGFPVPLGGTSNHLRTDVLREVGGWDAWNVTEDADLGLRLASAGYRVQVADSTTWEECPDHPWPWIIQRTRWLKGYLLTLLVHTRRPGPAGRRFGAAGLATLAGVLAGTPVVFMLWPAAIILALLSHARALLGGFAAESAGTVSAAMGIACGMLSLFMLIAGYRRRLSWGLAVLVPLYWLLHAFAAWRGLLQLIRAPYTWEKTTHHSSAQAPKIPARR
jgi:cellulose synthase/poly-beta-1,6-N-acetylglucosamine synthase-like glycosyltransferase